MRNPRSTGSRSSAARSRARTAATASPAAAAPRATACSRSATAPGHAITKQLRKAFDASPGVAFPNHPLTSLEPTPTGWLAQCGDEPIDAGTVVLAAGGRCFKEAEERGELSTNHPERDRRGDRDRDRARRRGARPRRAAVPPERRRLAREHAGLLDPRDDPCLRRRAPQRRGRGVHRLARPARRRLGQAIFDEVEAGRGVETEEGRPAVYLDTTRIPEADADVSLPYMLRRYRAGGIDPLREKILTYPVLHYQNGGLVIDADAETTLEGPVRLRRDRRRHPRSQPHDGKLAARVRRFRTPRRQRAAAEKASA